MTKTLQKLDLYRNKISDDGAVAISDSLKINASLQKLDLRCNNITKAEGVLKPFKHIVKSYLFDDGAAAIGD